MVASTCDFKDTVKKNAIPTVEIKIEKKGNNISINILPKLWQNILKLKTKL